MPFLHCSRCFTVYFLFFFFLIGSIAAPAFFWFLLAFYIFFPSLDFLCVCLFTFIFYSFSNKLLISVSLRFLLLLGFLLFFPFRLVLCLHFAWLCLFPLYIRWNNYLPNLEGMALCLEMNCIFHSHPRSWLSVEPLWLSKQPDLFLIFPVVEAVSITYQCSKGK